MNFVTRGERTETVYRPHPLAQPTQEERTNKRSVAQSANPRKTKKSKEKQGARRPKGETHTTLGPLSPQAAGHGECCQRPLGKGGPLGPEGPETAAAHAGCGLRQSHARCTKTLQPLGWRPPSKRQAVQPGYVARCERRSHRLASRHAAPVGRLAPGLANQGYGVSPTIIDGHTPWLR